MQLILLVGGTASVVLTLAGYFRYTSIGLDFERRVEDGSVSYYFVRIRWPGDGSVWIGGERTRLTELKREPQAVDLGATLFARARPSTPRTVWNRMGFWLVREPGRAWVGVPGVLVLATVLGGSWWCWRRVRSREARLVP